MSEENNTSNEVNINEEKKEVSGGFKIQPKWIYFGLLIVFLWFIFNGNEEKKEERENETEYKNNEQVFGEQEENKEDNEKISEDEVNISTKDSDLKEVLISSRPYIPVSNIYIDKDSYNKNTFRLALKGEFNEIKLIIKGKTENDLKNFLSVNLGIFSGNYIIEKDFNKENKLSVSINLNKDENFIGKDNIVLWKYIEPTVSKDNATIVRVYATIFDENGKYANQSEITELKLVYSCAENDPDCKVLVCDDNSKSGGSCLIDEFGVDVSKNYINYFTK